MSESGNVVVCGQSYLEELHSSIGCTAPGSRGEDHDEDVKDTGGPGFALETVCDKGKVVLTVAVEEAANFPESHIPAVLVVSSSAESTHS